MAVSQQAMIISVRISDAEDIVALKSHIICSCSDHKFVSSWLITFVAQAQALYGSEAPPGQQFSILILQKSIYCHAKLIVYTEPNSYQRFKVLETHTEKFHQVKAALEGLGGKVQRSINHRMPDLKVGETWDGGLPSYDGSV